ncbi:hypothetical protein MKX01_018548 [Papaver californicum]|nr:hypothetical protein MKX01_018548 [Papaver californicum]
MRSLKGTCLCMELQWKNLNYRTTVSGLKQFSSLPSDGNLDIRKWNKKISNLIRGGQINEARRFFDTLQYKNTVTWNSMISGYVKNREIVKARELFDEMPQRDVVSWNLIISGYVSSRGSKQIEEGRYLFDQIPSGDVVRAMELFKEMPQRDSASISALVSGLIQNGKLDEAAKVLFEIKSLNNGVADLIHAYNTLMAGYGQCGRIVEARRLFDQIPSYLDEGRVVSCGTSCYVDIIARFWRGTNAGLALAVPIVNSYTVDVVNVLNDLIVGEGG